MRPLILSALIGLLIGIPGRPLASNPAASPQQERDGDRFTIAVDVNLVVFNATVTDSRGRHVSGLTASDFSVYEENRLQNIALLNAEDSSASVGLIIDNSGSMRAKRTDVVNAALAFAGASMAEDELFVLNFNENIYLGLPPSIPFTNNISEISSALLATAPEGMTALYDAVAAGIEHLKAGTRDRKALVVLSDGGDNASHRSLNDVTEIARRSNATIYTIGIYDDTDRDRNPGVLRKLAELSGGRAYFPDSLNDLDRVWRDIAGQIRNQYTIGYRSNNNGNHSGQYRRVKITASRNGRSLRVIARDGYFVPNGSTPK